MHILLLLATCAVADTYEAPKVVREASEAKLTAGPMVTRHDGILAIKFTVNAATDVEVAVLDAKGKVVRHLAAGLLGENAPEPFQLNSLSQELAWDGKDDAGRPADGGPFKVRVRVGSQARLDKIVGRNDDWLNGIRAVTVSPRGELFVLLADAYRGRSEMRVLDRDGRYLRTIIPYPADTPKARTKPVGHVVIDGHRQPLVFNGQGHTFYPFVAGLRGQTMAWHPDGYLLAASSVGSMCNHGPPRFLLAFHPEGGVPENVGYVGPKIRRAIGFIGGAGEGSSRGMDRIAVSPDGEWIYLVTDIKRSRLFQERERQHGVFRVKWTDTEVGTPWLGNKEAGAGDDEFNDPQGLAVDSQGRLYVCDRENNRVKLHSPEGDLLGQFPAPLPEQIAVHPRTGEIYIMSRPAARPYDIFKSEEEISSRLFKFSAWNAEPPKELMRAEFENKERVIELMALDASGESPRLWVTFYLGWKRSSGLVSITEEDGEFKLHEAIGNDDGLDYPSFLAADPARNRVLVYEHLNARAHRGHKSIDLQTDEVTVLDTRGSDLTIDADGNLYVMDGYNSNTMSRYDPDFKPLPFPDTDSNKMQVPLRAYGPSMGLRGHVVTPAGDIYVRRSPNHARVSTVDVYGPDGKLKKANVVHGAGSGDSGIGVDNRGNVYLGMNLKPADSIMPDEFARVVPVSAWRYYRRERDKRSTPWCDIYANPYIFHMGSVFKFGPDGGRIYGNFDTRSVDEGETELALAKAPADGVPYKSSYLGWDVKVVGAQWRYAGVGIIPHSFDGFRGDDGCECLQTQLDADLYGRVYAPSVFYSSIEMIDSAGNRIARLGGYGNADSAGNDSRVPDPEIALAWPAEVDYAEFDGKLYVTDSVNRRVVVIRFEWADSKEVQVD